MIPLRPIYFAIEDKEQIVLLIVETLKRLQVALDGATKLQCIRFLWSKIEALMTDAVSKNLKIECME